MSRKKTLPHPRTEERPNKLFSVPPGLRVVGETQEVVGGYVVVGADDNDLFWSSGHVPLLQFTDLAFFDQEQFAQVALSLSALFSELSQSLTK